MRSPRSPRLSPLLVSLAQSTEHPGNSRGLMGHLLRHPAKSKGEVMRSPRSPRLSPLLVSLAQSTEHPGNSRGLMGHLLRHPAKSKGEVMRSRRSPRLSPLLVSLAQSTEIQPGVFQDVLAYTQGPKDIPAIFFYLLISVVMHAIIQEYLLDKVNKKLHLSKIKHAKFNESGQLLAFYITSI